MSRAGAVDGARLRRQHLHEPRDELLEAALAHPPHDGPEGARRHGAHLRHRVEQRLLQARDHLGQVGRQVLRGGCRGARSGGVTPRWSHQAIHNTQRLAAGFLLFVLDLLS